MIVYVRGVQSEPVAAALELSSLRHVEISWVDAKLQWGSGFHDRVMELIEAGYHVGIHSGSGAEGGVAAYLDDVLPLVEFLDYITDYDAHPAHTPALSAVLRDQILDALGEAHCERLMPVLAEPYEEISMTDYATAWSRLAVPPRPVAEYRRLIADLPEVAWHGIGVSLDDVLTVPFLSCSTGVLLDAARAGAVYQYRGRGRLVRLFDSSTKFHRRGLVKRRLQPDVEAAGLDYIEFFAETTSVLVRWNTVQLERYIQDLSTEDAPSHALVRTGPAPLAVSGRGELRSRDEAQLPYVLRNAPLAGGRRCDTCTLAKVCPSFAQGSDCSIDFMPVVDGSDDVRRVGEAMIAMQLQRTQFALYEERLRGGALNTEVSKELELLNKMLGQQQKGAGGPKISIQAEGAEGVNILSAIMANSGSLAPTGGSSHTSRAARRALREEGARAAIVDVTPEKFEDEG